MPVQRRNLINMMLFIFYVFLLGCAGAQDKQTIEQGRAINENCLEDIREVKIIEVHKGHGALARVCETEHHCFGVTVAIPSSPEDLFWDGKKIKPPKDQCFIVDGTLEYESGRTLPIVVFGYKYPAKDGEEVVNRLDSSFAPFYKKCLMSNESSEELCGCFFDQIKSIALDRYDLPVDEIDEASLQDEWFKKSAEHCGRSPSEMKWLD